MKVLILGSNGMLGNALVKAFSIDSGYQLLTPNSKELDLTDKFEVFYYFKENKPDLVLNAAGLVKGLYGNLTNNQDMYKVNLAIGLNVAEAVKEYGGKLIYFSSSCVYPLNTPLPYKESDYFNLGPHNPDNFGYARAKSQVSEFILRNKLGLVIVPPNLFGVRRLSDVKNFENLHMLETFTLKSVTCRKITVKCSPEIRREILSAKVLARVILKYWEVMYAFEHKLINIGPGSSVSLRDICERITSYNGTEVNYDFDGYGSLLDKYMDTTLFESIVGIKLSNFEGFAQYIKAPFRED